MGEKSILKKKRVFVKKRGVFLLRKGGIGVSVHSNEMKISFGKR